MLEGFCCNDTNLWTSLLFICVPVFLIIFIYKFNGQQQTFSIKCYNKQIFQLHIQYNYC